MLYYRELNVWMVNNSTGKNETRNARVLFAVLSQHMSGTTEKDHDKSYVGVTEFRTGISTRGFLNSRSMRAKHRTAASILLNLFDINNHCSWINVIK
jgi:hypothetical protein